MQWNRIQINPMQCSACSGTNYRKRCKSENIVHSSMCTEEGKHHLWRKGKGKFVSVLLKERVTMTSTALSRSDHATIPSHHSQSQFCHGASDLSQVTTITSALILLGGLPFGCPLSFTPTQLPILSLVPALSYHTSLTLPPSADDIQFCPGRNAMVATSKIRHPVKVVLENLLARTRSSYLVL